MKIKYIVVIVLLFVLNKSFSQGLLLNELDYPQTYICYKTDSKLLIDGVLNEDVWQKAEWSKSFVDIEGNKKPLPFLDTKVKLLWDDEYLYIGAYIEEPHIWAKLTERESVIFYDNDFEVFIDPDGDTHKYIELEINAFNTQWDLLLLKPYRDDKYNVAIDNWNINGLKTAVKLYGSINNPNDIDSCWTVEIAIPFDAIVEVDNRKTKPKSGDFYRLNFSRVQWLTDFVNGDYQKKYKEEKGKKINLPEQNWVWSPQGVIAMHQPESWGYLQFSEDIVGTKKQKIIFDEDFEFNKALRHLYYFQNQYFKENKKYADKQLCLNKLLKHEPLLKNLELFISDDYYQAKIVSEKGNKIYSITNDGKYIIIKL